MKTAFQSARGAPLVLGLAALLSACGGGGGDGGGNGTPGGGTTPVAANPVFAVPAGPLCSAKVDGGICAQPTSSSTTMDALVAALRNPAGPAIRFESADVEAHGQYTTVTGGGMTTLTASVKSARLVDKAVDIGRASIDLDGTSYAYSEDSTAGAKYKIDDHDVASWGVTVVGDLNVTSVYGYNASSSAGADTVTISGGQNAWNTQFGLLTDQADAPTDSEIQYSGGVVIVGGDGSPVGTYNNNSLLGRCPLTATFSPATGLLKIAAVSCTYAPGGLLPVNLSFSITDLKILSSRVDVSTGTSATITMSGRAPVATTFAPDANGQALSLNFDVSEIAGTVYQKAAKTIYVQGGNASGQFHVQLVRQ